MLSNDLKNIVDYEESFEFCLRYLNSMNVSFISDICRYSKKLTNKVYINVFKTLPNFYVIFELC